MFLRVSAFLAVVIAAAAAAPNILVRQGGSCNTGSLSCCDSLQPVDNPSVISLLGSLGILQDLTGSIGLDCIPITAIGVGTGANCQQQPVCCNGSTAGGVVGLGCIPVSLGL
ncbi:fungal hydrophobin-domain-containing protein [Pisolithus orientalis]|uniref:Hydrophobin n=1 Tax=Pisolithus tinctorius Marx 270 TaxID=870435 RepID=A0A0C3JYU3_PISTI|nr:fungal hydrophobin-domain-containing protein [Pisolithus orientalis]KAI6015229.1 fungal hydrophobin-domain-containing protein [Pisolithus orientalis]KAI6145005.1 fungal hydrophobin-domain-containing protein [Pisolithus tinctorius]KIO02562.1 hypothetical protein M404DRAFT_147713 [Pisolithus tinctorius Marx 270]